jgi:hypothetical protein
MLLHNITRMSTNPIYIIKYLRTTFLDLYITLTDLFKTRHKHNPALYDLCKADNLMLLK